MVLMFQDLFSRLNSDIYRSYSQSDSAARAFSFTVIRPVAFSSSSTQSKKTLGLNFFLYGQDSLTIHILLIFN